MDMKMTRFITLIFCMLSTSVAFAQDVYKPFVAGRFDSYLGAEYFTTSANYDSNGSKQSLLPGASLTDISTDLSIRYLFWDNFGLNTGLTFNSVDTNNGVQSRSNSELTYYTLGADLELYHTYNWSLYVEGQFKIANEQISLTADDAIASDGASEGLLSGVGVFQNEDWRMYAKLGYDYRAEGLSALLRYGVGADYALGKFRVGLDFPGYSSVQDDEKTSTPTDRDLLTNRVNAGSKKFYAINPNSLEGTLYGTYSWNNSFAVKIYGGSTLIGSNSAEGIVAGIQLNWGFGPAKKNFKSKDVPNKSNFSDDEEGFKVDTNDGVNQEIFQKSQTAPAPKKK
jgi:opacity protein-like surface antigen